MKTEVMAADFNYQGILKAKRTKTNILHETNRDLNPVSIECEPGSSVSIVSDYGLDDRANEVRSPAGTEDFFLVSVSRPALGPTQPPVQWVPGIFSQGVKRGRGVTLTTYRN
jgi:hypothetical protein